VSEVPVKASSVPMIDSGAETRPLSVVSTLATIRTSASTIVPYVTYGANRLGKLGIAGLSLCIFSVIAFVSSNVPLRQELASQESDLNTVRLDAADRRAGKVADTPQRQASKFVGSLPTPNDVPRIMGSIVAVAAATGIELKRGSYEFVTGSGDSIAQYQMSLPVTGSYPQVRQFVENVLATVPAISLEGMRLERDKVADQVIAADLKFSILLGGSS
jgi:hypothetical protein